MFRTAIALTVLLWAIEAHADDDEIIVSGKAAIAVKLIDPDLARLTQCAFAICSIPRG